MTLAQKLHPSRFTAMSPRMAAIVAYILGEAWTEPTIGGLSITSDGFLIADGNLIGDVASLDHNILMLFAVTDLDDSERASFMRQYRAKVQDWRR